ncbi:MAG: hypothetical protein H7339_17115 [Arcicella sp.]|nr:hypothetical protein [Arcicella sp.]
MIYETINQFVKTAKTSRSSVYRFYKKNDGLWEETKMKSNKRMIPQSHAKYFDSDLLFDELQTSILEIKSLRRLIDCLADKETLPATFWNLDWSFFVTVAYRAERNKKSCFRMMTAMFDEINTKYGDSTDLRMFFTTEPFANRKGYHNHFVIYIENRQLQTQIMQDIEKFFEYDRVDSSIYDKYKAGLFYITKDGLENEDWYFDCNLNTAV